MVDEGVDSLHELSDGAERTAPNGLLRDQTKPTLHLIEPRAVGGREMQLIPGSARQPGADRGVLVRAIVVEDEMNVEIGRDIGVDVLQKGEELLVPVPALALGEDLAALH